MNNELISRLADFVDNVVKLGSAEDFKEFETVNESSDEDELRLINSINTLAEKYIACREKLRGSERVNALTEYEQNENMLVQQLLDENLFTYHFQPIVRADNGEIYGYEALMRAGEMKNITPFHILKYAELTGRLTDVEYYTFSNILKLTTENRFLFSGRSVFINSMPKVKLSPERNDNVQLLLKERAVEIVVEMIENAQFADGELGEIKDRLNDLGIPIAIDDFGTGYSNIHNLLRYKPNIVKIDRSLLSGIESNPNKKHFVREIIDFCHENRILALAEGVETSDELRTVILLGADLIQGYYTARPTAEIIDEIPYSIRSEISAHTQERENGRRLRVYNAEKNERISLDHLSHDDYSSIHIGSECSDGTVTVVGSPRSDSGIHIAAADGFTGTIVLENVWLSNFIEHPCIELGNYSKVAIRLNGSNRLENSGIRVPSTSSLTVEGDGDLTIDLGSADYFGIGNDAASEHGQLDFNQDGTITIKAESHAGTCIGSGRGGIININRGRYVLNAMGSTSVCIGAIEGNTKIQLVGCDAECKASGALSTVIGSVNGNSDIHIMYSSVRIVCDGQLAVAIGSLTGGNAKLRLESINISTSVSADALCVYGAADGDSDITIERVSMNIIANGTNALVFGGFYKNTQLTIIDIDLSGEVFTELNSVVMTGSENIYVKGGKLRLMFNSEMLTGIKGLT